MRISHVIVTHRGVSENYQDEDNVCKSGDRVSEVKKTGDYIRRLSSLSLHIYLPIEKHTKMYIPLCMHYVIIGAIILKKILILRIGAVKL